MALKTYTLEILYDDETDNIEYVKEFISTSDAPVFIPYPDSIEIDQETWDSINNGEVGES
jgi:hypothetical protein